MPNAETYALEMVYFPWKRTLERIVTNIEGRLNWEKRRAKHEVAPVTVLDLMCGTGELLYQLAQKLEVDGALFTGVDISSEYLGYARGLLPSATFIEEDVRQWQPEQQYSIILITGGLHHLPFEDQIPFLERVAGMLETNGIFVLAEPCLPSGSEESEKQRRLGAARLGYEYLREVIEADAPLEVIRAAVEIIQRDIELDGEFKRSADVLGWIILRKLCMPFELRLEGDFSLRHPVWGFPDSDGGDYLFFLKRTE